MKLLTDQGAGWLARLEDDNPKGPKLDAFEDTGGVWTIGYGNTWWTPTRKVQKGDKLNSVAEAVELYRTKLRDFCAWTSAMIPDSVEDNLSDPQYSALVSACYNMGPGNLRRSPIIEAVISRDKNIGSIWRSCHIRDATGKIRKGLIYRRYCEVVAWSNGAYITQARASIELTPRTVEAMMNPSTGV